MKPEEIAKEIQKCKDNPYYFATTYLTIKAKNSNETIPFRTLLSEKEFNDLIKNYENNKTKY